MEDLNYLLPKWSTEKAGLPNHLLSAKGSSKCYHDRFFGNRKFGLFISSGVQD